MEISDLHLVTIKKYSLFNGLVGSNGIIDESVLDKLRCNVRSLLGSETCNDKDLLDLCLDVIYNRNMKATGLHNLMLLFTEWEKKRHGEETATMETNYE